MRKVEIDQLMAEREARLRNYALDSETYFVERALTQMMQPKHVPTKNKLGKRPITRDPFNQHLLGRSPGSSRHSGLDFVKAVYSDRTGQEQEEWNYQI